MQNLKISERANFSEKFQGETQVFPGEIMEQFYCCCSCAFVVMAT